MLLYSSSTQYQVMGLKGEGTFAQVRKCLDLNTLEFVAIKIHKEHDEDGFQQELETLEALRVLDPDKKNIVRFIEDFHFSGLPCMAFEMLDRSLWDLMNQKNGLLLSLNEIRPVTHQVLVALEALNDIGIMHRDLKPNNIMLVNHKEEPFRIKLIDFGMALPMCQAEDTKIVQNLSCRAPEVSLGLPLTEAIDMWSVGCIMAQMYFGYSLFPYKSAYNWMETMLHLLGWPSDKMLIAGKYTRSFFTFDSSAQWRLMTPEEYKKENLVSHVSKGVSCRDLDYEVQNCQEKQSDLEYKDRMMFLDLVKLCLHLDAQQRICPREALKHNFVTMVHMVDELETTSYGDTSLHLMVVSPLDNLDESLNAESDGVGDCSERSHADLCRSSASSSVSYDDIKDTTSLTCDGASASVSSNIQHVTVVRPVSASHVRTWRSLFQRSTTLFRKLRDSLCTS